MNSFLEWIRNAIFNPPPTRDSEKKLGANAEFRAGEDRQAAAASIDVQSQQLKKPNVISPATSDQQNGRQKGAIEGAQNRGKRPAREPHFVQIGLDFGTAYTKCVLRDVQKDLAWTFVPTNNRNRTLPFLLSSRLLRNGFLVERQNEDGAHYHDSEISLLKMAFAQLVSGRSDDSATASVRAALKAWGVDDSESIQWVEGLLALYLASVLREVRADIRRRLKDFGENPKDYMAVNLAIPVAELEDEPIRCAFSRALHVAWEHCDTAQLPIDIRDWMGQIRPTQETVDISSDRSACFVFPEVSANVQGFVRSRTSNPGVYLFSDTGAGTVDQSVFIFSRGEYEQLTYLGAQVLPLGSAMLENLAAAMEEGAATPAAVERLRREKESGKRHRGLDQVRHSMKNEISRQTLVLLAGVKVKKLGCSQQLNNTEMIFGGGGNAEIPYEVGVRESFKATIFPEGLNPRAIGMPLPLDLELPREVDPQLGLRRLSVAYGLSFPKFDIAPFILPHNVTPAQRICRQRVIPDAPTMDEC